MVLVVATRNRDKLDLIRSLVPTHVDLQSVGTGFDADEPDPGPGTARQRLARIAAGKAIAASAGSREVTIATDGGLLIPALDGWDPVRTRRFAGPVASDDDRARALLALAIDLRAHQRQIGWCEAIAVARHGRLVFGATAESAPGWLAGSLESDGAGPGDGFWVPRLWRDRDGGPAQPGAWTRLAPVVRPFLAGLFQS